MTTFRQYLTEGFLKNLFKKKSDATGHQPDAASEYGLERTPAPPTHGKQLKKYQRKNAASREALKKLNFNSADHH